MTRCNQRTKNNFNSPPPAETAPRKAQQKSRIKSRLPVGSLPAAPTPAVGAVFIQARIPLCHLDD